MRDQISIETRKRKQHFELNTRNRAINKIRIISYFEKINILLRNSGIYDVLLKFATITANLFF